MNIQLIRHATMLLEIKDTKFLLDPMLSPAGQMTPVPDVPNKSNNPLVDLPFEITNFHDVDGVIITHTHRDHFDNAAIELMPKNIPIFCQPEDETKLKTYNFSNVTPIRHFHKCNDIEIHLTRGQHGKGKVAEQMGPVSGFVLFSTNEPSLYIVGDSIWCDEVEQTFDKYQPDITICFAGAAQLL